MRNTETVITSLTKQWINEERTEMSAGIELQNLASIGYMDAVDMLKAERKKIINIQMQMEIRDQEDQLDNEQWERDYEAGVMA
tara:strand:- start:160 stop:408 length:249 start_codon:yes stop_codon:yes gene_type:complete